MYSLPFELVYILFQYTYNEILVISVMFVNSGITYSFYLILLDYQFILVINLKNLKDKVIIQDQ